MGIASAGLAELLRAIDAYEKFSRFLQDAFDDVLFRLSSLLTPPASPLPPDPARRPSSILGSGSPRGQAGARPKGAPFCGHDEER